MNADWSLVNFVTTSKLKERSCRQIEGVLKEQIKFQISALYLTEINTVIEMFGVWVAL
jgi:hypothetical protein